MAIHQFSRRDVLSKCFAAGLLVAAVPLAESSVLAWWEEAERRKLKPTPPNDLGPFYKAGAPKASRLVRPGDPGLPLSVSGAVFDTRGDALPEALVEIWHTDAFGHYDNQGFHYRAQLNAGKKGEYAFDTSLPGHYPDRVAQHIHYQVSAPGCKTVVTQLYFATDPVFEGDPDKNYTKDPLCTSRELIRPVRVYPDPKAMHSAVTFEVVLERA